MADEPVQKFGAQLDGAVIRRAEYTDPAASEAWGDHGRLRLELADGRVIEVTSAGYDASAVLLYIDGEEVDYGNAT